MDKLKDWEILSYRNPNCFTDIKGADIIGANGKDIHTYIASTRQYPIHSVKRLSDGVVFTKMERDGNGFLITGFKVIGSEMEVELDYGSQKKRLSNLTPPILPQIDEDAFKNRCNVCGDDLVYIRGKYPHTDKRQTCPTCTTERLEQINEISNKDYGKAYQSKN